MNNSEKIKLSYQTKTFHNSKLSIVFLHGFTGSSNDWLPFFNQLTEPGNLIAVDLPGHGKNYSSVTPEFYNSEFIINEIDSIIKNLCIGKVILAGYSMGGRAALSYVCSFPERVNGLVLESTTAGLEDPVQRKERVEQDLKLAEFIEQNSIEDFIDYWLNLPLFSSQKKLDKKIRDEIRSKKLFNNPVGLANSLRVFGTGSMENLWPDLNKINCPTLLITGQLDEKFTSINRRMNNEIKNSKHSIIENCGHNTHLERPEVFVSLLDGFVKQFI
jgi:2-succinyl-6-hydroxy-2,4-cyclohexadiene-1-carboxylate synthase